MQGGNMQGDHDRVTFDPIDRYVSVLGQQGRVQLPADGNEQTAIHHHLLRSLIIDLKGRGWRPDHGFEIGVTNDSELGIGKGHCYIDGILCENAEERGVAAQPYAPIPEGASKALDLLLQGVEPFALYLDCWERHVSWLNDPRLREVALGGPDTATRLQIAWQVLPLSVAAAEMELEQVLAALARAIDGESKTARLAAINTAKKALSNAKKSTWEKLQGALDAFDGALPLLTVDVKEPRGEIDPCALSADAEYRGRENQLYRVEVHAPGLAGEATFKWSRENGSVAFKVLELESDAGAKTTRVTLESLGHDRRTGLCKNDWVELADHDTEMRREAPELLKVVEVDAQRRVTLEGESTVDPTKRATLRRWDHRADPDAEGCVAVKEGNGATDWIDLERGIKIRFELGGNYRTGDSWRFAARAATGEVEWPRDENGALPRGPHGVKHHRTLLAILESSGPRKWKADNLAKP